MADNVVMTEQANRSSVGMRLEEALRDAGMRNSKLAELTGVTIQGVGGWMRHGRIDRDHLPVICDALGITVDWLLFGREPKRPIRALTTPEGRIIELNPEYRRIPVISYIQAGHAREVVDDHAEGSGLDTVGVDHEVSEILGPHSFALIVQGDSMMPDFREGDIVVIDPDAPVRPGDFVVAKLNAEQAATLKRYRDRGADSSGNPRFELVPLNDFYPTLMVDTSNPGRLIGPVVEHRRKLR